LTWHAGENLEWICIGLKDIITCWRNIYLHLSKAFCSNLVWICIKFPLYLTYLNKAIIDNYEILMNCVFIVIPNVDFVIPIVAFQRGNHPWSINVCFVTNFLLLVKIPTFPKIPTYWLYATDQLLLLVYC